jgi:hypothetical protein
MQSLRPPICPGVCAAAGLGRVPGVGRAPAQGTALLARHLPCSRREYDVADGVSESSATRRRPRILTYTPRSAANHSGSLPWRLKRTNSAVLSAKRPITRADHSQPKTSVKDRQISRFSGRIAAAGPSMRRSKCAESGYCALFSLRKGLTSNHKAGQRAKMAWSNGKSAIFGLKTADLNGGFRLISRVPEYAEWPAATWLYTCVSSRRTRNIKARPRTRQAFQGPLLEGKIGLDVDVGRLDALVTEPKGDHGHVDASLQQVHGTGVSTMSLKT